MKLFEIKILSFDNYDVNELDDNVDVIIVLENGREYAATFFSLTNIKSLFVKNRDTGECANGLYLWASDMIIVERLTKEVIFETVSDMIKENDLEAAVSRIK